MLRLAVAPFVWYLAPEIGTMAIAEVADLQVRAEQSHEATRVREWGMRGPALIVA